MTAEHPRDVLREMTVTEDVGRYEPQYLDMRLQFRRDGSVTWRTIPKAERKTGHWTYDTKAGTIVREES